MSSISLLCDSGVPRIARYEIPAGISVFPWRGDDNTDDLQIVEMAYRNGHQGVVFMGQTVLKRQEVKDAAKQHDVAVIAANTDDPAEAKQRLVRCASAIPGLIKGGSRLIALSTRKPRAI